MALVDFSSSTTSTTTPMALCEVVEDHCESSARRFMYNSIATEWARERAEDVQRNLDPKHPSFLKPSQVSGAFILNPHRLCNEYLSKEDVIFTLVNENEVPFTVRLSGRKFGVGWKAFSNDNNLVERDALVFELVKPAKFQAYIIRAYGSSGVDGSLDKDDIEYLANFEPDSIAISTILAVFSSSKLGFEVHGWVVRRGLESNLSIVNSLIVVYSDQGKLERMRWLFNFMSKRDVISWNSIISVLSACANLGFVEEGRRLFVEMQNKYRIKPRMEYFACMVNLFGRADLITEAYEMIVQKMVSNASPTVWGALLYACFLHGNVDVGEIAAEKLFELEPDNAHNFELLMMIYGKAGRWEDVENVMRLMVARGLDS
ncbi:hypothetical protein GIB67_004539 [Kingdonia uniflora]|uniref:TF-B3 domain-containing protein n=1 Tax=Kingdonia uniflora TaxID=39325 RepID=A0A7J7MKU3_9MAGN|nr:hypothetical protein GIB67_004539 [Kingdonia uniflora]